MTVTQLHPDEFDQFWTALPKGMRRAGKKLPREAFAKARQITDLKTILDGVAAYRRGKPDWQAYCMAATWLNQERWDAEFEDEESRPVIAPRGEYLGHGAWKR